MSEELTPQSSEISLRDYMDLLRRRKYIVIQTFVVVIMVGLVVTFMTKPTFRTGTRILVEGREATIAQFSTSDPLSNLFMPDVGHDIPTQIEVLQGEAVLKDAFQKAGVPPSEVRLEIKEVGGTDIIEILAESTQPEMAERIARQMPLTYRLYMSGNRKTEIKDALTSSQDKLRIEQERLIEAEKALEVFKERINLPNVEADKSQKIAQQGSAEGDLIKAEAEVASGQARLQSALADRKKQPDFIESKTTTVSQALKEQIRDQISQLEIKRQEALNLYKPEHFQVKMLDTEIAEQKKRLEHIPTSTEVSTKVSNPNLNLYEQRIGDARAAVAAATVSVQLARRNVAVASASLNKYSALDTRVMDLQRELATRQDNVAALTKTVNMLDLRDKAYHDPVTVITPAGPAEQVAPKKLTNLAYSAIVGLILGLGLALLQEFLDDRVNSPEDARRLLKTPVLGYVPLIEKEDGRLLSQNRSSGSVLESYRVLRSNVQFATVGATVNSLLVTSTIPGEGKSITAANLAVAMAIDGRRVILVDADLRRPTVHVKFGTQQSPGLTNVLVGHTALEEALRETSIPNLQLLTAGPLPPNPAELLNSEPMQQLHQQLKELVDVVIFDSPPCLATADAQVMAASVDGVLYVIQFGETKKSGIRHAVELLQQAHANILGVIFNKIELSTGQDHYYYGYYNYYQSVPGDTRRRRTSSEFDALLSRNDAAVSEEGIAAVEPGVAVAAVVGTEPTTEAKEVATAGDAEPTTDAKEEEKA
jgi:polysaccharide biosynthesis transport protein